MPALAVAPAPRARLTSAPEPESEPEPSPPGFFGRSLAEYVACFALDLAALRGRDVLDVAAGAASFVAEARARKINAVAVDPLYGGELEALAARLQLEAARAIERMRTKPRRSRPKNFPSFAVAELDRRTAAQRFFADYAAHFIHNRYLGASLPRLPFFDGTFDLVLCGHLLFADAERFDHDWHLAACRELVRVSAGEVRIHPLGDADGKPFPAFARLRRELKETGIASEVRAVDGEFIDGAASMLVLRRQAS